MMEAEHSSFSFGAWVHRRRRALDLTQEELVRLVGVAAVTIHKIEVDERRPSAQVAERLAVHLRLANDQQDRFVQVARGVLAPEHLPAPTLGTDSQSNPHISNLPTEYHTATEQQVAVGGQSIGSGISGPAAPSGVVTLRFTNQVSLLDLPAACSPRKNLDASRTNLPAQVNALIGRSHEVADVSARLQGRVRLVTLLGPGGIGKTRLALQVGAELFDQYADGVWFVDLAPVSDPAQVASAVAQALMLPESPDRPIRDAVLGWARERQALLLLDNCEHIVVGVARLASDLLQSGPNLQILATSRIPLRIAAEQEYIVESLGLPSPGTLPSPEQLGQYDAITLFSTRVRAVRPDFSITDANASVVAQICAQVDGLPLALELAAARMRLFSAEQLLSRLIASQLQTLMGGARDSPTRQQTIRATIDWSYRLLQPTQQQLLARLGVFVGGWTLEAAEVVCNDPELAVAEGLEALVEQSLVQLIDTDGNPRYTMLETIRQYAIERLAELDQTAQLEQRHGAYFIAFAELAEQHLRSAEQREWLGRLDAAYPNLVTALTRNSEYAIRLCGALWHYWWLRNAFGEWQRCTQSIYSQLSALFSDSDKPDLVVTLSPEQAKVYARAALALGRYTELVGADTLEEQIGEYLSQLAHQSQDDWLITMAASFRCASFQDAQNVLALARATGDSWLITWGLWDMIFRGVSKDLAPAYGDEMLTHARKTGDWLRIRSALYAAGFANISNNPDLAKTYFEELRSTAQAYQDTLSIAFALYGFARVAQSVGDYASARAYDQQRLPIEQQLGKPEGVANIHLYLGMLALDEGDFPQLQAQLDMARMVLGSRDSPGMNWWIRRVESTGFHEQGRRLEAMVSLSQQANYYHHVDKKPDWVIALSEHALSALAQGDWSVARQSTDQAASQETSLDPNDNKALLAKAALHMARGLLARHEGDLRQAEDSLRDALMLSLKTSHNLFDHATIKLYLCGVLLAAHKLAEAIPLLYEALGAFRKIGARHRIARSLELVAQCSPMPQAIRLWGAAEALRVQIGISQWPVDRAEYERSVAEARSMVDPVAWDTAWAAGRALPWEEATDEALAWLDSAR